MLLSNKRTLYNALAEEYDAYRPHYPPESLLFLVTLADLDRSSIVADVGSGTGRIALALAPYVHTMYAMDTAHAMLRKLRENAEAQNTKNIEILESAAEETGLQKDSLDLAILAQAFHWVDKAATLQEMHRVLKPGMQLVLMWNDAIPKSGSMDAEIASLVAKFNPSYTKGADIDSRDFPDLIAESNKFEPPDRYTFPFSVIYTRESYLGFLLSKSYIGLGIPQYELPAFMIAVMELLADLHGSKGIREDYETVMLASRAI